MRPAVKLPVTYREIVPKYDAYVFNTQLRELMVKNDRYWSFHGIPTTVALPSNTYAKSLNAFTDHCEDEGRFRELLREYGDAGCQRPSSYADPFHETFYSPRVPWSINALFAPCLAGGWQQAIGDGVHRGVYRKYDMRSAYLWSATLGLPDTRTYGRSLSIQPDGIFRVKLSEKARTAPFPFNQARECIATGIEIETYGLRVAEVVEGVVWKSTIPGDSIINAVKGFSTWKQIGRCYWGRWGQVQKVECNAHGRRWFLPNTKLNIPWAHIIVSRVKMRVWEFAKNAVHVYVDSVITKDELPTGENLGDWRLEKVYNSGVFVRGPGQYGDLNSDRMERYAGVSKDSPQRYNSVAVGSVGETTTGDW